MVKVINQEFDIELVKLSFLDKIKWTYRMWFGYKTNIKVKKNENKFMRYNI